MGAVHAPVCCSVAEHNNTYLHDECLALRAVQQHTATAVYLPGVSTGRPLCEANVYFSMINLYGSHRKIEYRCNMLLNGDKGSDIFLFSKRAGRVVSVHQRLGEADAGGDDLHERGYQEEDGCGVIDPVRPLVSLQNEEGVGLGAGLPPLAGDVRPTCGREAQEDEGDECKICHFCDKLVC